jgi:hypothetical protein
MLAPSRPTSAWPAAPPAHAPSAVTPAAGGAAPPRCPNCGAPAPDAYCPACGQEQRDYHRSVRAFVAELLDNLAGWDGKIPTTLWLLVRHPGRLTAEFLAGRRVRYLRPLRLYLSASVVLFLTLAATADGRRAGGVNINIGDPELAAAPARTGAAGAASPGRGDSWVDAWYRERKQRLASMPKAERGRALGRSVQDKLPNTVFALVPVFALLLRAAYWRRGVYYAEHLVFALHVHAFAMLALTAVRLGPKWAGPALLLVVLPAYLFVALRRVYGGSRPRTLLRLAALGAAYVVVLVAAVSMTAILALVLL